MPFFFLGVAVFFSNLLGGVVVELPFLRSFWVVLFSPSFSWCCQFAASPLWEVGSSLFRNESSGLLGVVLFSRFFLSWWCCCFGGVSFRCCFVSWAVLFLNSLVCAFTYSFCSVVLLFLHLLGVVLPLLLYTI